MYEPVATFIQGKTESFIEGELLKVTQEMGIVVDREGLLKALQYDRGQYEKGYKDGYRDAQKQGQWIPIEYDGYADGHPVWDLWECSECREEHSGDEDTLTTYCPNCGAIMDGGNDDA